MRLFTAVLALWMGAAGVAFACDLDDCPLPTAGHLESAELSRVPMDRWGWMNHDLALAQAWLSDGDDAMALEVATVLDEAMRAQLAPLVRTRGLSRVRALHRALQRVVIASGGAPLAPLSPAG